MKAHLLCILCTLRAAYSMVKKAVDSEEIQKKAVIEVLKWLSDRAESLTSVTPAALHTYAFKTVQRISGCRDPFMRLKKMSNNLAMKIVPALMREINGRAKDEAIKMAVLGAVCGNSIDFEVEGHCAPIEDLERALLNCLRIGLTIDDTDKLISHLSESREILYLLDNAGEIVFDKLLISTITKSYPVRVVAAVKSGPILNDVTLEDALEVGLDECAEVITTGSDSVGLDLKEITEEFKKRLKGADLIIAKGQGYYESLTELESILSKPIVYMLRAKCQVVACSLNVPQGSNIVKFVGKV